MHEIQAPSKYCAGQRPWIFLAGSIDQGKAEAWQKNIVARFSALAGTILNPRRDDWDNSWVQQADTDPFRQQVLWELSAQEDVDAVLMYFAPDSLAPITLLELGLLAQSTKLFVGCPVRFYRRGNVELVCRRYDIPMAETLEDLADTVLRTITRAREGSQ